jgi:hypothetical protein
MVLMGNSIFCQFIMPVFTKNKFYSIDILFF